MSEIRDFLNDRSAGTTPEPNPVGASSWLTADFVEQIQRAHMKGRPVSQHISKLTAATLTGLVEYGCLRSAVTGLPDLPRTVQESDLGRNLSRIVSVMGLRQSGRAAPANTSHNPLEIEFVVVRDEADLLSDPIQMMFIRVTQAMRQAGFTGRTANEFQAAFHEMISNAVEHSLTPVPALAGYHIRPSTASFVVADLGRGVFDSLRENPDYRGIADHCEAINLALHDGVTRCHDSVRGNGFRPVFKSIVENWGVLRFRSRKGCLTMSGADLSVDQGTSHFPPDLPGFQVSVACHAASLQQTPPAI